MNKNAKQKLRVILVVVVIVMTACLLIGCVTERREITINLPEGFSMTEAAAAAMLTSNVRVESRKDNVLSRGAGVILTENGYILTNKHVLSSDKDVSSIKRATITVEYMLPNYNLVKRGATYVEEENTTDIQHIDLAILKIKDDMTPITNLNPVTFASEDTIRYGTQALMVGNPKGLGIMIANAMVASPKITIFDAIEEQGRILPFHYVAINADVNGGNSGGGLYSYEGKLMGIVTLREVDTTDDNANVVLGIGYAIHISDINEYLKVYADEVGNR